MKAHHQILHRIGFTTILVIFVFRIGKPRSFPRCTAAAVRFAIVQYCVTGLGIVALCSRTKPMLLVNIDIGVHPHHLSQLLVAFRLRRRQGLITKMSSIAMFR